MRLTVHCKSTSSFHSFLPSFLPPDRLDFDATAATRLALSDNKKNWPSVKLVSPLRDYLYATEEVLPGGRPAADQSRGQRPEHSEHAAQVVHQLAAGLHGVQHILDLRRLQPDAAEHPGRPGSRRKTRKTRSRRSRKTTTSGASAKRCDRRPGRRSRAGCALGGSSPK